jgi:chitinase
MKQLIIIPVSLALLINLSSCGSGKNSNSANSSLPTAVEAVPLGSQVKTPSSSYTNFAAMLPKHNMNFGDQKCIQVLSNIDGSTFKKQTTAINDGILTSITFTVTNVCSATFVNTEGRVKNITSTVANNIVNLLQQDISIAQISASPTNTATLIPTITVGPASNGNSNNSDIIIALKSPFCDQPPNSTTCAWAQIQSGAKITYAITIKSHAPIADIKADAVEFKGILAKMPHNPLAPGNLNVAISSSDAIKKVCSSASKTACNLQIAVSGPSSKQISTIYINPASSNINYGNYYHKLTNLLPGQYTLELIPSSIPNIAGGTISCDISAPKLIVGPGTIAQSAVSCNYSTASTTTGTLTVNLAGLSDPTAAQTLAKIGAIHGMLTNNTTQVITPFQINLGSSVKIPSLSVTDNYTLHLQGIGDPISGTYFAGVTASNIGVSSTGSSQNIAYGTQIPVNQLTSTSVTLNNFPQGSISESVSFADNTNSYQYQSDNINGSSVNFSVPSDQTVTVNFGTMTGYLISSTPSPLNIGNSSNTTSATVNYTPVTNSSSMHRKNSAGSDGLMIGYLSGTGGINVDEFVTVPQATSIGYNVPILAFVALAVTVNSDGTTTSSVEWQGTGAVNPTITGQFLAYTNQNTTSSCYNAISTMKNDIQSALSSGAAKYVMMSLSGTNPAITFAGNQANINWNIVAQSLIQFMQFYGINGIDFDLEGSAPPLSESQFNALLPALRTAATNANMTIIISAVPQANSVSTTGSTTDLGFVSGGTVQYFNSAITANLLDYLWLQVYNTGASSNQIVYGNGICTNNICDETQTGYVPAAYYYFTESNLNLPWPTGNLKLGIGEPVNANGVQIPTQSISIWMTAANAAESAAIMSSLASNYSTISTESLFAGAMGWAINQDVAESCLFVQSIAPVVTSNFVAASCPSVAAATYQESINVGTCLSCSNLSSPSALCPSVGIANAIDATAITVTG